MTNKGPKHMLPEMFQKGPLVDLGAQDGVGAVSYVNQDLSIHSTAYVQSRDEMNPLLCVLHMPSSQHHPTLPILSSISAHNCSLAPALFLPALESRTDLCPPAEWDPGHR